jgi:hypothetical protein
MVHITYTDDPQKMRKTTKLLKILIANPTQPIDPLSKELGMNRHTVYERAYGFGCIYETGQPDELLAFYNCRIASEEQKN